MTEREKLIEIIQKSVDGCAEYWAGLIADGILESDVAISKTPQNLANEDSKVEQINMTNYEKIKNMSLDEMAKCISDVNNCILCELKYPDCLEIDADEYDCSVGVKKWLESKVTE